MKIFYRAGVPFGFTKGRIYCMEPMFLDIETSNNHASDPKDLITWIVSIQVYFNDQYYLFRYPEEFIEYLRSLDAKLSLSSESTFKKKLIIYIHNASYDLSYLIPYINMLPDDPDSKYHGIIESPNKFLTYVRGPFEFRCSYRLAGMSLEKWSNEYNIEHKKAIGLYDYNAILYPDSELSEDQKIYDRNDVLAMAECLSKQFKYYSDDITSVPLTSTGYIRRTLRRSCRNDKHYKKEYFLKTKLDPELYEICLKAYAGGYTHNNRFFNDRLIRCGHQYEYIDGSGIYIKVDSMKHRDFKSHYPTQATCYPMPTGRPQLVYKCEMGYDLTIETVLSWYPEYTSYCIVMIEDPYLSDPLISMPFMQYSKCYQEDIENKVLDNGRILKLKGSFFMYLDTLTMNILKEQYHFKYKIIKCYRIKNSMLPDCIIKVIDYFFKGKSDQKNIVKELTKQYGKLDERTINADFELMHLKRGLNATYGVFATNPLRDTIGMDELMRFFPIDSFITLDEISKGLENFYAGKNNFLPYQIGGAITSAARYELYEYIKTIGYDHCLYCDTDSIFYISDPEIEKRIESLNAEKNKNAHSVILDNGKTEYYDSFELEPDVLAFKGLHSKCYGIVTEKGLEITIAGVPARTMVDCIDGEPVYITREDEISIINYDRKKYRKIMENKDKKGILEKLKDPDPFAALDHLTIDFKFYINTGVNALYVGATGYDTDRKPTILNINGHEIHTAGGCVIRQNESKNIRDIGILKINSDNYEEQITIETLR